MAYTYKMVNGVKTSLNSADQTALAAKDAANWQPGQEPSAATLMVSTVNTASPAGKLARMAQAFGLTVDELKAEIADS